MPKFRSTLINLSITIIAGVYYGIFGILFGKIISIGFIVIFWKPYYLFSTGFNIPISTYWNGAIRYYAIFIISFFICLLLNQQIHINPYNSFICWIEYCTISICAYLIINILLLLLFAKGGKDFVKRLK